MSAGTSAAARGRRVKKAIAKSIETNVSRAFNETAELVAREHPGCYSYPRWFVQALVEYARSYDQYNVDWLFRKRQKRRKR